MPIMYTGRVFSVETESVRLPNGRQHNVETVRHRPSVVLLPMHGADRIVLVQQYRHSIARRIWELPAGSLEAGESAEAAAIRECEEEIGLVPGRIERIRSLFPAPGFCDEELIYFRLWDLTPPPADSGRQPDEDEDISARVFTVADAKAMASRGDIVDLKTAYGLTLL